jgi:hypothetical protein
MTSRLLIFAVLVACACPSKQGPTGAGGGSATAGGGGGPAPGCDGITAKLEQMYRAEAETRDKARVEEAVADNTAMVMAECTRAPEQVSACVRAAATLAEIETKCLGPLDDEGTEGEVFRK